MTNPSQEPPESSKAPNQDLKYMDVLCMFKIKVKSWNSKHRCIKDQWLYPNQYQDTKPQSETSSILQSTNSGLKDLDVLCTFKIMIGSLPEHRVIKDKWPYPNKDQDPKPQSGISSILWSPKSVLKGHWCSLHLQHQDREPKIGTWVYQRPVTICLSRSKS